MLGNLKGRIRGLPWVRIREIAIPPGFTPVDKDGKKGEAQCIDELDDQHLSSSKTKNDSGSSKGVSSHRRSDIRFSKAHSGGSILNLIDEQVKKLSDVDKALDQVGFNKATLKYRSTLLKDLQDINSIKASDISQKAKDVVAAVSHFFSSGSFPRGCNASFITLIPKIQDAKVVKDFCPISLIGSVYKIIAKAFDSVRWDNLDDVLKAFGFGEKWQGWISGCLTTATRPVLVNGSPTLKFCFSKGLKQGDPLSPFLFILIMESLHLSFGEILDAGLFKVLKTGEYDLWSMRMEQYLTFTDHALWEVIVNGDSVSPVAIASTGAEGLIPPKTTKQKLGRKNELKAKSTLMLAIPDELY
ncbi:RNA-directed DNA polymerase, eukaryota [Tanacetum coccineum]